MFSEFLLFGITLTLTIYYTFSFAHDYTQRLNDYAHIALTSGAIIAAPVAWYYFIAPILLLIVR